MWFSPSKIKVAAFAMAASLIFSVPAVNAQHNHNFSCGTDEYWKEKEKNDPGLAQRRLNFMNDAVKKEASRMKGGQDEVRIIPVVFHIMHTYGSENISKQRVLDQLKTLNETFSGSNPDTNQVKNQYKNLIADSRVEFRLATKDPNGNCTDGIVRVYTTQTENARDNIKSISRWNTDMYLNIWVVSSINNYGGAGTVLGYAQFPFDNDKTTDGIVMRADQVFYGNKTLTHEVGHYLGLFHTFETFSGAGCGGNCSSSGDWICDTPPSTGPTQGCPSSTYNSCTKDNPDLPDMTENFMDYSSCTRMFTIGQKDRMDYYFTSSKRSSLISESNLTATGVNSTQSSNCKPVADFYAQQYVVCEGGSIIFRDNSYNGTPTNYEWTVSGSNTTTSNDKDPIIKFTQKGTYTVSLKVSNSLGSSQVERQAIIRVLPAVSEVKAPLYQDFEDFGSTDPANEFEFSRDYKNIGFSLRTGNSAGTGDKSIFLNNGSATSEETYYVTLPPVDMTKANGAELRFKLAYAQINSTTTDELRVQVSSSCGQSYATMFYKAGAKLSTVTGYKTVSFTPSAADWREESINLNSYKDVKNLVIRFSLKSKRGTNVYLDDINIGNAWPTALKDENVQQAVFNIYPNPAQYSIYLSAQGFEPQNANVLVYDATGKQLQNLQNLQIGGTTEPIHFTRDALNIKSEGVYYIKLMAGSNTFVQKLVITK